MVHQLLEFGKTFNYAGKNHTHFCIHTHLHEHCELLVVKSGILQADVSGKSYYLNANQILFILPNQPHSYNHNSKFPNTCHDDVCFCTLFNRDIIPLFFEMLGHRTLKSPVFDFSDKLELLENLLSLDNNDILEITANLYLICNEILKRGELDRSAAVDDGKILHKIIPYLSEHYSEDITLKDLAKKFGYNEKYLSSTLHSLTDMNFRTLLSSYRVEKAQNLLQRTPLSISDIAYESGFNSINSFNRIFKTVVGISPTDYRKNSKNKHERDN